MAESRTPPLFDLQGKVAIVTGAARGNGRAITEGLVRAGVDVALADILKEELAASAQAMLGGGGKVLAVETDVSRPDDLRRLVERTAEAFGRIDILVNCAGITGQGRSEDYDDQRWLHIFDVNTNAAFRLGKLVVPHMIKQKGGAIINITSVAASLGFPGDPAYLASKGALRQLTRALATDWARYNIRVNSICPGYFRTALTEKSWNDPAKRAVRANRSMLRRWGDSSELVGPVIFLASAASSFMTGQELAIDGGLTGTGMADLDW
jgi:NAD(P)-dependent dehydrogenase (short-subunit alcohol dehydrogenase family)